MHERASERSGSPRCFPSTLWRAVAFAPARTSRRRQHANKGAARATRRAAPQVFYVPVQLGFGGGSAFAHRAAGTRYGGGAHPGATPIWTPPPGLRTLVLVSRSRGALLRAP
ncbi:hypothetical protein GCM10009634_07980 [Saccharothrix xinjiangensis]